MQDEQLEGLSEDVGQIKKPRAASKRRRKRSRKKHDEHVHYAISVTDWNSYYSFRVSNPKSRFDSGPYSEIATLTFTGELIRPEGLKYKNAALTLCAQAEIMQERWDRPPLSIGSLNAHEDTLEAYIFIPAERMAALVALAQSGRVQIASIGGTRLRYRSGLVHSISLNTESDDDED